MKYYKYLLYIILFFLIGEFVVRMDLKFDPLTNSPEIISIKTRDSKIKHEVDNHSFIPNLNQIRILIIGDSYINGAKIDTSKIFSNILLVQLQNMYATQKEIIVLDVSKPSNNTIDNYLTFIEYQKLFKPNFIFWAYNYNDILGGVDSKQINSLKSNNQLNGKIKRVRKKLSTSTKFRKKLYSVSELAKYLINTTQKELKLKGILLPFGDFNYLTNSAYKKNSDIWEETQNIINDVSKTCTKEKINFIFYKLPEFNLLNRTELFAKADKAIADFMMINSNIFYLNGNNDFKNLTEKDFQISKYDGHPNELAHETMATSTSKFIIEKLRLENQKK